MKAKLLIQDAYAHMANEPDSVTEIKSGILKIKTEDDRTLYEIALNDDGSISISTNDTLKFNGDILDTQLIVKTKYSNQLIVSRDLYKQFTPK